MYNVLFREGDPYFDDYLDRYKVITMNNYHMKIVISLRGINYNEHPYLVYRIIGRQTKYAINLGTTTKYRKLGFKWEVI